MKMMTDIVYKHCKNMRVMGICYRSLIKTNKQTYKQTDKWMENNFGQKDRLEDFPDLPFTRTHKLTVGQIDKQKLSFQTCSTGHCSSTRSHRPELRSGC